MAAIPHGITKADKKIFANKLADIKEWFVNITISISIISTTHPIINRNIPTAHIPAGIATICKAVVLSFLFLLFFIVFTSQLFKKNMTEFYKNGLWNIAKNVAREKGNSNNIVVVVFRQFNEWI